MFLKSDVKRLSCSEEDAATIYLSSIYNQVHEDRFNFIGMVAGRPQAGKSMDTGTVGMLLDPTFFDNLEKRVVYSAKGFMDALLCVVRERKRGRFIMWDEAGVGMPARSWYDVSNKAISYAVQVAGVYGSIIFLVTQDLTYIDSQPRKLINSFFDVTRANRKYSVMRPYTIAVDRKTGKMYFNCPRIMTADRQCIKLSKGIKVMLPPKEFRKRYLDHSKPFKQRITEISLQRAEDFDSGRLERQDMSTDEIIREVASNIGNYESRSNRSKEGRRILNPILIGHDYNIPAKLAALVKARVEQRVNSAGQGK